VKRTPSRAHGSRGSLDRLRVEGDLPALDGAVAWLNSEPLTREALRGHVVVVQFWTYTCINWLRTLPYVRAWHERYRDDGLVVIGVHTPEFEFEADVDNVRREAAELHVDYPIAIDSDYALWQAFGNQFWPALYFVDAAGHIRHHHFGEGLYARSERVIQQLLGEAGRSDAPDDVVEVDGDGVEAPAAWRDLKASETYLGYERAARLATPDGVALDAPKDYREPERLKPDHWALAGGWTIGPQSVVSHEADARITYRFHARDVHLVMAPAAPGVSVPYRVQVDGRLPGANHGVDVDARGEGVLTEPRLYQLVRQKHSVEDRHLDIQFLEPGAAAFAFTFG
jgi:thiol-disulfide isomerase/thioredoxin